MSQIVATQPDAAATMPDFKKLLGDVGLTPEEMQKYMAKVLSGNKCAPSDSVCRDKQKRAVVMEEYMESNMAYKKAKKLRDEKLRDFEAVEYGGAAGIKKHNFQEGVKEGEKLKEKKTKEHEFMKRKIQDKIYLLEDQDIYVENLGNLSNMYASATHKGDEEIERLRNKRNVDARKVYYEDTATQFYVGINSYLKYVYWVLFAALVIVELYVWFKKRLKFSPYVAVGYSVFMLMYPFLMNMIVDGVLLILKKIYGMAPRDVYVNL